MARPTLPENEDDRLQCTLTVNKNGKIDSSQTGKSDISWDLSSNEFNILWNKANACIILKVQSNMIKSHDVDGYGNQVENKSVHSYGMVKIPLNNCSLSSQPPKWLELRGVHNEAFGEVVHITSKQNLGNIELVKHHGNVRSS